MSSGLAQQDLALTASAYARPASTGRPHTAQTAAKAKAPAKRKPSAIKRGPRGAKGTRGPKGETGAHGSQGSAGVAGAAGASGTQGGAGEAGAAGTPGTLGPMGDRVFRELPAEAVFKAWKEAWGP
jgi:hypothetical protein